MSLVENIRKRAEKLHLTISDVERYTGIPRNTIYTWDDRKPIAGRISQVAVLLNTTVNDLIEGEKGGNDGG